MLKRKRRALRVSYSAQKRYEKTPKGRYMRQKVNARARGIAFQLSFTEWWDIWQVSGKWSERGTKGYNYVMCRMSDAGAYQVGNVYIGLSRGNVAERNRLQAQKKHTRNATAVRWARSEPDASDSIFNAATAPF